MHFTEDEIREIRNRLPLEVPTVTDSLQSSDGSSALSAKQGNLLGGRLSLVESTEAAMRNIQTIYPWTGASGVYSMVSVPDDTVNNATNVRVAYELKKRTDDLSTQVNYIQQIIDQLSSGSGGGGGGSTVSWGVELSNNTVPLIVNGVSKTICLNGYSSGGGGTGGGYIGSTQVQTNSTPGQNLEGIGNATLSGNLSVTGTSTLTGNVTIGGTVFLPSTGKIVFGSNASTDPFIEYVAGTTNQFHFNKGLYSDYDVTAGGIGSGGGGGGGASALKDLNDVYDSLNPSVGDVLYYTGSTNKWDAKALSIKDLSDVYSSMSPSANQVLSYDSTNSRWEAKTLTIQELAGIASPTTGYLKFDNGSWSLASSTTTTYIGNTSHATTVSDIVLSSLSDGHVLVYDGTNSVWKNQAVPGVSTLYLGSYGHATSLGDIDMDSTFQNKQVLYYYGGHWTNASLDVNDIGLASGMSGSGYLYYTSGSGWSLETGGGGGGATYLNDLNDVDVTETYAYDGYVLTYNHSTGKYTLTAKGSGGNVGTLNTTATTAQLTSSSESFSNNITLHKVSKTGSYSDLLNTPSLATVATSGSYNDLSNKPTIPSTLDQISDGSNRKLPIGVSTSIGGTAGQPTVEASLVYSGSTTTAQLPVAECATVVKTAGIVSTISQNFTGKKTFSSDVTIGPYSNLIVNSRDDEPKLYFGRSINRTTAYPPAIDNIVANTAEGYYMLYDPSENEKCLHLYCGYNDAGNTALNNVNHKFVIHGNVEVRGNIVATGEIAAGA